MNLWFIFGCLLFLIDRFTKTVAFYYCSINEYYITSFLNYTYLLNQGISLSLFAPPTLYYFWILTIIICAWTLFFGICWFNEKDKSTYLSVGLFLITVGSSSNIVDRFLYHGVIDWIDFHYAHYHFPIFNLADAYIVLGTLFIFYTYIQE